MIVVLTKWNQLNANITRITNWIRAKDTMRVSELGHLVRGMHAQWVEACRWLRSAVLADRQHLLSLSSADPQLDCGTAAISYVFGVCFPGRWRGKTNFSPVRAALLCKQLGSDWYRRIYDDPKAVWLTPETFNVWKSKPEVTRAVADNLQLWVDSEALVGSLSAVGW